MIEAPSFRYGNASSTVKNTEVRLTSMIWRNSSSEVLPAGVVPGHARIRKQNVELTELLRGLFERLPCVRRSP